MTCLRQVRVGNERNNVFKLDIECSLDFHSQDILTRHKIMCAEFLEKHYDKVGRVS